MSVDLEKNRNDIVNAWSDVVDTKTDTDWALFGYEGHTNILKVVSTGNGGLIELTDELNSGKILYAFVKITNDKTDLTKYLLVNWQGEGAPTVRKGTCANHIRDISKVLTGAHLTLNARTEDDIDSDRILEKLNSIRFAVKENRPRIEDEPQKVAIGTNYSRVIPSKEINSKDRDSFWKKAEEEERMRVEAERGKQMNAKLELEKAQRLRETQAHSEREQKNQVDHAAAAATAETNNSNGVKLVEPKNIQMPKPTVERSTAQAEEMRQQRNQEARQLIGSTVHNAKAIFAQNTAAGQLTSKMVKTAPVKPVRNSITRSVNQQQQQSPESDKTQQQQQQPPQQQQQSSSPPPPQPAQPPSESSETSESTEVASPAANNKFQQEPQMTTNDQHLEDDDSDPYSTIKRSPYTKVMPSPPPPSNSQIEANGNGQQTVEQTRHEPQPIEGTDNIPEDSTTLDGILNDGLRARALYDYQADDESEITFDPGDIITHIDQIDEGWWQGLGPCGTYGLFPANYVELLND